MNNNFIDKRTPNILVLGDKNKKNHINRILTGQALSARHYQCGNYFEFLENSYINFYIGNDYKKEEELIYEKELFNNILTKHKITIIWYCFNSENKKVKEFDIQIIKKLQKLKYTVCIISTKVNTISEQEYNSFFSQLQQEIPFTNIYNYNENNGNKDYSKFIEWSFNIHYSKYDKLVKQNKNIDKIKLLKVVSVSVVAIGLIILLVRSCSASSSNTTQTISPSVKGSAEQDTANNSDIKQNIDSNKNNILQHV